MSTSAPIARDASPAGLLITVREWLSRVPLSIILLTMRIGVGSVFLKAGLLKYQSWDLTVKLFQDEYKVPLLDPAVAARMATFNELTVSVLIIVGLATRPATLPFLGMLFVIQTFVYPDSWTDTLVWGSILVMLLTRGAGAISLDHVIDRYVLSRTGSRH